MIEYFTPPSDGYAGAWVGRAWIPEPLAGPAVIAIRPEGAFDITALSPTVSALCDRPDPAGFLRDCQGPRIGSAPELLANSTEQGRDPSRPWLLAPVDLQAIKACGVTFATSLIERVVEEQAKGDPRAAAGVRESLTQEIGADLSRIVPGSDEAEALKQALVQRGMWSQYLEVGIGPDAEVFTKAQPLSAVGFGADIGIHPRSTWNNPEPEIVVIAASDGRIVGASLGNDVNLRDFEGRSALLLGKAKDNNASTAIGPFIRLFDAGFTLDDVRSSEIALRVLGEDGFVMDGVNPMSRISRSPENLVGQAMGAHHQYPDGLALFLGTMFAPTQERDGGAGGFTHKIGDVVVVSSPQLGTLVNRVRHTDKIAPWTFGVRALMANLAQRGLLQS